MGEADTLARAVAEAMLAREGTGPAWGIVILGAAEGVSRLSMRLRADMINGHGVAHGGIVFALADTAFAYACNSRNQTSVGHCATITYLGPAREGETLIADARETARVGRTGTYHVTVRTEDGRAIAEFMGASRTIGGAYMKD